MKIEFKNLDYNISPYTGLTRESWIEAGEYLLKEVFTGVKDINEPIVLNRFETEITYPHKNADADILKAEIMAERFEILCRTFFVGAPLIKNNPECEISGINIREYYKNQILRCCTKDDPLYVGDFNYLVEMKVNRDVFPKFQQTVECAAMVIGLWISKSEIWETYTDDEKEVLCEFIKTFAYGNTQHNNWHMFNMLCLAFLHSCGYHIDKAFMAEHANTILSFYAGDGWYRDNHSIDYYSCWAFNLYGPIWNRMYGYESEPELAEKFEHHSNKLMETFSDFFDRDGHTIMWGRSSIYRNAATSAFAGNAFLKNSKTDFGLARRIMSGSLKQFLCRDDFLCDGVPSLGFYGNFKYFLQPYSCAASPFWCAKPFLALYLPKEHPLWSEKENNGWWENGEKLHKTTLDAPALCFTNHQSNGETILRTGKVSKDKDNIGEIRNYAKLSYNSKYPWDASPDDIAGLETQQYVLCETNTDNVLHGNVMYWAGEKDGILYRKQFFGYHTEEDPARIHSMYLADFAVSNGLVRVDKLNLYRWPVDISLGSYGFSDNGTEIIRKTDGNATAIILKGKDHHGNKKQLAMTIYDGWDNLDYVTSIGTNPDSEKSVIIYATTKREKAYDGNSKKVLISQVVTKENHEDFKDEEIFSIESVKYSDTYQTGAFGEIKITLKNGKCYTVDFEKVDGRLSI